MPGITKNVEKVYNRIRKALEKMIQTDKRQPVPQLVLQPLRNKKI